MQNAVFQKDELFCIKNAVTFETVAVIQKDVMHLIHSNPSLAVYAIDLAGVTEVNSAALGLLVELKKYAVTRKKVVVFLNFPERLLSLAQVCSVAEWLRA